MGFELKKLVIKFVWPNLRYLYTIISYYWCFVYIYCCYRHTKGLQDTRSQQLVKTHCYVNVIK